MKKHIISYILMFFIFMVYFISGYLLGCYQGVNLPRETKIKVINDIQE